MWQDSLTALVQEMCELISYPTHKEPLNYEFKKVEME